ncbi:MAG: signal peptidase II [Deltaproteobacteria bacterium]|nr:signal peptidase II [Deltaproteobacteria bacterium]
MRQGAWIKKYRLPAAVALSVAVIDQLTKALAASSILRGEVVEVIPGFFNLVYVNNPGAAFGMFAEGGIAAFVFLVAVSIVALGVIAYMLKQSVSKLTDVSLSLIAGGAVGNLIDRVRFSSVVDFLDFHVKGYHWPAFNIADTAITSGVVLTLVAIVFSKDKA